MINIFISSNRPYLPGIKVLMYSLKETQKEDFTVYFACYRDKPLEEEVLSFSKTIGVNCKIISLEGKIQDTYDKMYSVHHLLRITIECFSRLLSPVLFPDLDRVLWLDTDIVVTKNLSDFYHQDFEGNYISAAHGYCLVDDITNLLNGYPERANKREIRKDRLDYAEIKSSVVLFNLELLRTVPTFSIDRMCNILLAEAPVWWCDQSLLSTLCYGAIKYFDKNKVNPDILIGVKYYDKIFGDQIAYDCIGVKYDNTPESEKEFQRKVNSCYSWRVFADNGLMIHYTNSTKPWQEDIRKYVQGYEDRDDQTWYKCEERMNKYLSSLSDNASMRSIFNLKKLHL